MTWLCNITGHRWLFNFRSIPNKAICKRCSRKMRLDLHTLEWSRVDNFEGEERTDQELKDKWV